MSLFAQNNENSFEITGIEFQIWTGNNCEMCRFNNKCDLKTSLIEAVNTLNIEDIVAKTVGYTVNNGKIELSKRCNEYEESDFWKIPF